MSRWRAESAYLGRYATVGLVNTVGGFAIIFALTWLGYHALVANVAGYAFGFTLGFVLSKIWVFRASGPIRTEGMRYALAFSAAFVANLLTLQLGLSVLELSPLVAQGLAIFVYSGGMFLLSRLFVFQAPGG